MVSVKKVFFSFLLVFIFILNLSQAADDISFSFAVWGDSQLNNPDVFEKIVQETAKQNPELVIHVGDMINGYSTSDEQVYKEWEIFKKQISPIKCDFYPTPGNHDTTTDMMEPIYDEIWGKDKKTYSFNYKDAHFIILSTYQHSKGFKLLDEEIVWLKNDLEKNKECKNIFISMHVPLYMDSEFKWEPVQAILKKYNVRTVFSGHAHIFDYQKIDGIDYYCINSSGNMGRYGLEAGYGHCFMKVDVMKDGKINYSVFTVDNKYPGNIAGHLEYKRSAPYYQKDLSYIIPDPAKGNVSEIIRVPVDNATSETLEYTVTWNTKKEGQKVEPQEAKIKLNPKEKKITEFIINIPKGEYKMETLPSVKISVPYKNSNGYESVLATEQFLFVPPVTAGIPADQKITVDGQVNEIFWEKAPAIKEKFITKGGVIAPEQTEVKIAYDDKNFYVSCKGEEPNPKGLKSLAAGNIPLVFSDDDFEIYVDPGRTMSKYYRMMINPKGTILSSGPKGLFTYKCEIKTFVGDNFWSAEFAVPYQEINANAPKKGDEWGFNFRRRRLQVEDSISEWTKMNIHPAQPELFGIIKFE